MALPKDVNQNHEDEKEGLITSLLFPSCKM